MLADKKSFTKAKRRKIAEIKEIYDYIHSKAMVAKLVLGEKNIKKNLHRTEKWILFQEHMPPVQSIIKLNVYCNYCNE